MSRFIDRAGQRFNRWTVLSLAPPSKSGTNWNCRCDCGNEKVVFGGSLTSGLSKSCGCLSSESSSRRATQRNHDAAEDHTGKQFGRWTVLGLGQRGAGRSTWRLRCRCGTEAVRQITSLQTGNSMSCGCLQRDLSSALNRRDISGHVFGRLTVIERAPPKRERVSFWRCSCECGNVVEARSDQLACGETQSCGCLNRDNATSKILRFNYDRAEFYASLRWQMQESASLEAHEEHLESKAALA